jgi:hypothetical protein
MSRKTRYLIYLALWLLTVPPGLLMVLADTHGEIFVRSVWDAIYLGVVGIWIYFPVWGYFAYRRSRD